MARRPSDEIAGARWPQGRQVIWNAIRELSADAASFTLTDVWHGVKGEIHRRTIRSYLEGLTKAGIVNTIPPTGPGKAKTFSLRKNPGAEAPRVNKDGIEVTQGLGNEAMWRTMKILGSFTAAELALNASTEKALITEETAKTYLRYLSRAGFVAVVQAAARGNTGGRARYRFASSKDPGPLPPQVQRVKQVWDPNSERVVWPLREDAS